MIGRILSNRYKLIAELGSGGMAWVYLGEDLVAQRNVAVKVLYPQHSQDPIFLQRFAREAELSMALSQAAPQKNIVRLWDYGADRDIHYLVMEYVPGEDLGRRLAAEGTLALPVALDLACQVAQALDHAHCHDIVHRDIKPSNIMILPDGTVRVLDFGIARARTSPEVTLSGFVGSPNYAAPEQATGKPVDIRADIYSLGIVLYRMLGGRLPFEGDTPWQVINLHMGGTPPSLAKLRPDLPQEVIDVVATAMAKRPEDRFQTPAQMVTALRGILDDRPVARPATMDEQIEEGASPPLATLYRDGCQAMEARRWQEAVDLFSRCLKIDPGYRDVSEQLSAAGQQIQLATLYRSARRALERGQWQKALEQLSAISAIDPDYEEVVDLRDRAEREERSPCEGQASGSDFPTQVGAAAPAATVVGRERRLGRRARWWLGILLFLLVLLAGGYLLLDGGSLWGAPAAGQRQSETPSVQSSPSHVASALVPSSSPFPYLAEASVSAPTLQPTDTVGPLASSTTVAFATPTIADQLTALPTARPVATQTASPTASPSPDATETPPVSAVPQPTLSGQIAFPRFDPGAGTYEVHVCDANGSGCHRLATEASQPDFLPGGRQLVVHSWRSDRKGLLLVDLDGNTIWQISGQIEAARPSVDFQGESYVYHSRQEADRRPRLYRTYGAETRPLLREASMIEGQAPAWTPGGDILYAGCVGDACGILLTGAHGGDTRQVVAGGTETNPEASPNGQRVAFMSTRDGNWELYVANLNTDNAQRLTDDPASDGLPAWSPDGRWLAFVSDRGGGWAVWALRFDSQGRPSAPLRLFDIGGPLQGEVAGAAPHEVHGWLEERISWGE